MYDHLNRNQLIWFRYGRLPGLDELADREIQAAEATGQAGFYAEACFWCQQAVEKELKALLIKKTGDFPKTHSLRELSIKAGIFNHIKNKIADLDTDYSASRYFTTMEPTKGDGYTAEKFKSRIKQANEAIGLIRKWIND